MAERIISAAKEARKFKIVVVIPAVPYVSAESSMIDD